MENDYLSLIEDSKNFFFEVLLKDKELQEELQNNVDPKDIILDLHSYGILAYHREYYCPLEFVKFDINCKTDVLTGYLVTYFRNMEFIDATLDWSFK